MTGPQMTGVQRALYYAMLQVLNGEDVPIDLWPVLVDGAAGRVKDEALTVYAVGLADVSRTAEDNLNENEGGQGNG